MTDTNPATAPASTPPPVVRTDTDALGTFALPQLDAPAPAAAPAEPITHPATGEYRRKVDPAKGPSGAWHRITDRGASPLDRKAACGRVLLVTQSHSDDGSGLDVDDLCAGCGPTSGPVEL